MKKIIFHCEFGTEPYFYDLEKMDSLPLEEYNLSESLIKDLCVWQKMLQDTFDQDNPSDNSKFLQIKDNWIEQGKILYEKVREELKEEYEIEFPKLGS